MVKDELKNWPPIEGRYEVGNPFSPVAVCTNASIDEIKVDLQKVALIGKCVTENIGIEKIIQNIVSNPNIRYLVLCGRESKGHFVAQAIQALKKNGLDNEKRIIEAMGNMPYLRNLDEKIIKRFREQIRIVNIVGETSSSKIEEVIDKLLKEKPEKISAEFIEIKKMEEIEARPTEWFTDPKGYFIILTNRERKKIIVEHYENGKINKKISGNNAKEICDTVARLNLIGNFEQTKEHSMYLARELQKAEFALKNNLDYKQDSKLKIENKGYKEAQDEYEWHD